jgi:hypothetical protein
VIADEGTTTISACATDTNGMNRGNTTATVRIDRTAPQTSDDHVASYTGSATVHLSVVDTMSGVDYTRYCVDSGAAATGTLVSVSTAGAHTLEYASVDEAGNSEATHTITFTVTASRREYSTRLTLTGASSVRRGRTYTLSVRMVPKAATGIVTLTLQRRVGGRWQTLVTKRVRLANGKAVWRIHPQYRSSRRVNARYGGLTTSSSVYRSCTATKAFEVK